MEAVPSSSHDIVMETMPFSVPCESDLPIFTSSPHPGQIADSSLMLFLGVPHVSGAAFLVEGVAFWTAAGVGKSLSTDGNPVYPLALVDPSKGAQWK